MKRAFLSETAMFVIFFIVFIVGIILVKSTDANVARHNIKQEAENFSIYRRILFFNGITDKVLLEIIGRCSVTTNISKKRLEVVCEVGKR